MKFAGRAVVVSSVDPVPRSLRVGAGVVVMTADEARAIADGDQATAQRLHDAIARHERGLLLRQLKEGAR